MSLLEGNRVTKTFGGLIAVNKVDFFVSEGEILGLIGPNGAGKTTLFNTVTGVYQPTSGVISFKSREISGMLPSKVTELGIARTFQNIRLFGEMTVMENVLVGCHCRFVSGLLSVLFHTPKAIRAERAAQNRSQELMQFVGISEYASQLARNLPYGSQRRLEIARALASGPELLFLDEPAAGMNPQETEELIALIREIRNQGITVVLIEHDMKVVMEVCERIIVLDHGEKISEGTPSQVRRDPAVITAYLGGSCSMEEGQDGGG